MKFVSEKLKMMSKRNKECLRANHEELMECLQCGLVLDSMAAKGHIHFSLKESIEKCNNDQEKNRKFFDWLRTASDGAYYDFLPILRDTKQSHLARLLEDWTENGHPQHFEFATTTPTRKRPALEGCGPNQTADISTPGKTAKCQSTIHIS